MPPKEKEQKDGGEGAFPVINTFEDALRTAQNIKDEIGKKGGKSVDHVTASAIYNNKEDLNGRSRVSIWDRLRKK